MVVRIGIRREDKNEWERRVPLSPSDVAMLKRDHDIQTVLQPFPTRAFHDAEYRVVGAEIDENLTDCPIVLAIKEMPIDFFREGLTYVFFAHVIKGQSYNMPMLRQLLDLNCNLIDYEKITDDNGIRLVFFGKEAGQAGMIDTLWTLGRRLTADGIENPFIGVRQANEYRRLSYVEQALIQVREELTSNGVPDEVHPIVFGFAGYGNVSDGAQEILDLLPVAEISPGELLNPTADTFDKKDHVYKVVFKEEHMVDPVDPDHAFELQDYYDKPERYRGVFERYIPHLTVLVNCIYWDDRYPRLLSKELVHELYSGGGRPKLRVIGDISCDVDGAVEVNMRATDSGSPVYVYDVDKGDAVDGVEGNGPVILAVDNLPTELPRESSARFSSTLAPLVPYLVKADLTVKFDKAELPPPLKRAMICYRGKLTPDFEYLIEHL